jgi:hypothetical protein
MRMRRCLFLFLVALTAAHAQTAPSYDAVIRQYNPILNLPLTESSGNLTDTAHGYTFVPAGNILYHQPSTIPGRYAIAVAQTTGAAFKATDNTVASWDWNRPWWAIIRVKITPRGNNTLYRQILFSKGHLTNSSLDATGNNGGGYVAYLYWNPFLRPHGGLEACFNAKPLADHTSGYKTCTAAVPTQNLFDGVHNNTYTLAFSYDGTGSANSMNIFIEGQGWGMEPAIIGTPTANTMNDPNSPLILGGDIDNLAITSSSNPNPLVVEAFAMGSGPIPGGLLYSLNSSAPFADQVLTSPPANGTSPQNLIIDDDGCADTDNANLVALMIQSVKQHRANILLINSTTITDSPLSGQVLYRAMLDQAGLHNVPVSYANPGVQNGDCKDTDLAPFTRNYPTYHYETDVTAYRKALAAAPDHSVAIISGGSAISIARLLQSPRDRISPLTGAQLFARKVSGIYVQQSISSAGNWNGTDLPSAQYVAAHHSSVPLLFYGDNTPFANTGPGVPETRSPNDPLAAIIVRDQADSRPSWDSWPGLCLLYAEYWCKNTWSGEGTITFPTAQSAIFSTSTPDHTFNAGIAGSWGSIGYPGADNTGIVPPMFMNSLIQPRPEPKLLIR